MDINDKMKESINEIPKKKQPIRYDENGNPIPRKKRPIRYDENGNPIPRKRPVRRDADGNTAPVKRYPQPKEKDRPIPLRRQESPSGEMKKAISDPNFTEGKDKQAAQVEEKKPKRNYMGIVLASLQAIISIVFFVVLLMLDMLPIKYLVVIGVILVVLLAFTILSQFAKAGRKVGWVFATIMILIFGIASIYIWKAHDVIDEVTQTEESVTKLSDVSIIVLANSRYNGLEDLKGKEFGVQKILDRENTELTLQNLEAKLQVQVDTVEYESWKSQVQALYNQDVEVIVINELYRSLILEDFEDFDEKTRVLDGFTYQEKIEKNDNSSKADIKVDVEPFNVYLSGNDSYGKISMEAGRSDVNIIATVNPKTKQILLTTTPRDFYVELPFYGGGYYDKLTHAGMYGLDTSIETLENLYQIEIDYYVRLNFSGFRDIVDALDGVEVYSAHEFTSVKGVYFSQGMNYLNGKEALAFVRERKAFADGDFQRGRNQMAMIEALANKIFSPAILTNYMDLMDSVSSCFITDMPRGKINDLVKMQLNDGAEWTIISNSVMGYGNTRTTYSTGNEPLSCVDPDVGDVALATELILKCMNGEKVVIPDKEAEGIYQGSRIGSIGLNYTTQESSLNALQSGVTSTVTGDSGISSSPNLEQSSGVGGQDSGNSSSSGSQQIVPEVNQSSAATSDSDITNGNSSASDSISTSPETSENTGAESSEPVVETPEDSAAVDPGAENTGTIVQ